jgi:hypothetical protein
MADPDLNQIPPIISALGGLSPEVALTLIGGIITLAFVAGCLMFYHYKSKERIAQADQQGKDRRADKYAAALSSIQMSMAESTAQNVKVLADVSTTLTSLKAAVEDNTIAVRTLIATNSSGVSVTDSRKIIMYEMEELCAGFVRTSKHSLFRNNYAGFEDDVRAANFTVLTTLVNASIRKLDSLKLSVEHGHYIRMVDNGGRRIPALILECWEAIEPLYSIHIADGEKGGPLMKHKLGRAARAIEEVFDRHMIKGNSRVEAAYTDDETHADLHAMIGEKRRLRHDDSGLTHVISDTYQAKAS